MIILKQLFAVALIILAFTGALCNIALFAIIMMVRRGGFVQFGYQEDNSDEIINTNNNEKE